LVGIHLHSEDLVPDQHGMNVRTDLVLYLFLLQPAGV